MPNVPSSIPCIKYKRKTRTKVKCKLEREEKELLYHEKNRESPTFEDSAYATAKNKKKKKTRERKKISEARGARILKEKIRFPATLKTRCECLVSPGNEERLRSRLTKSSRHVRKLVGSRSGRVSRRLSSSERGRIKGVECTHAR